MVAVQGNLVGNIDYSKWKPIDGSNKQTIPTGAPITYEDDKITLSTSNEKCTDGKDDGKIGFWSAAGNILKGAGKTVLNGVKGLFTNKDGKFSLGKTLLSVGTAALCIAVPAVGVAACVVGGVMGAAQLGKGIYNAATADTDAEAKQAWQNVGGGALTVATSVVGAKAGVKAVKATSTASAAGASAADEATGALGKLSGFGKDMISSTKNGLGSIKNTAGTMAEAAKLKGLEFKANKAFAKDINNMSAIDDYNTAWNSASWQAKDMLNKTDNILKGINSVKNSVQSGVKTFGQQGIKVLKHPIQTANELWRSTRGLVTKDNALALWEGFQSLPQKTLQNFQKIDLKGTASKIYTELTSGETTYAQAVDKYGYDNVAQVIQYLGGIIFSGETLE